MVIVSIVVVGVDVDVAGLVVDTVVEVVVDSVVEVVVDTVVEVVVEGVGVVVMGVAVVVGAVSPPPHPVTSPGQLQTPTSVSQAVPGGHWKRYCWYWPVDQRSVHL